jgi:hypothetical protein
VDIKQIKLILYVVLVLAGWFFLAIYKYSSMELENFLFLLGLWIYSNHLMYGFLFNKDMWCGIADTRLGKNVSIRILYFIISLFVLLRIIF